jgi:hypothetical protein
VRRHWPPCWTQSPPFETLVGWLPECRLCPPFPRVPCSAPASGASSGWSRSVCLLCPAPALAVRASAKAGDLDAVLAACDRVRDVALPKVRQCMCVCLGRREHSHAWHYCPALGCRRGSALRTTRCQAPPRYDPCRRDLCGAFPGHSASPCRAHGTTAPPVPRRALARCGSWCLLRKPRGPGRGREEPLGAPVAVAMLGLPLRRRRIQVGCSRLVALCCALTRFPWLVVCTDEQ